MDRRMFLQASLAGLLTHNCGCARARAASTIHGCRMAKSAGDELGVRLLKPPQGLDYLLKGRITGGGGQQVRNSLRSAGRYELLR